MVRQGSSGSSCFVSKVEGVLSFVDSAPPHKQPDSLGTHCFLPEVADSGL